MLGLVVLIIVISVAFVAPQTRLIERHGPSTITTDKQLGPTADHWFGTDQLGRDTWSRTLEGVRISIEIGLGTQLVEVRRVLERGGTVGKRLDFLMQELNREANTLGSKAADNEVSQTAVELKVLIEQMREQVQNIE